MIEKISGVFPGHVRFRTIASFSQYSGSDHPEAKSKLVQVGVYLYAFVRVVFAGLLLRDAIFHVHLSVKGSTLRKGMICTALRVLRCRYVVHAHAAEDAMFHEWVPNPVRRVLLWGLGGAGSFIALTRFWADYYAAALGIPADRVILLPNPAVLPPALPDRTAREGLHFLFAGRIGKRKGAFELIQAFASLPPEIRNRSRITLAGDGEVDAARDLAGRLGCSAQISVPGWVEPEESERLLGDADVFLLPSHAEGMSMAVLEAMAWGLPVVTTASGGADEFLLSGRNCLLTKPGDIPELAAAMSALAQDPQLRIRLGAEARKTASGFRVELYVEKLTGLYEELARPVRGNVRMQPEFTAKQDLPSAPAPALEASRKLRSW
jgi:glycosyltransferase involved in cell wall biosynthesis